MTPEFTEALRALKNETGVGLLDCKDALKKSKGNIDEARVFLREKGLIDVVMDDKPDVHREGFLAVYTHGRMSAMIELNCVNRLTVHDPRFKDLAHNLCLQVAGCEPRYVHHHEIPFSEVNLQRELYRKLNWKDSEEETKAEVKRLMHEEYYPKVCLLDQEYIKGEKTVRETLEEVGEKIKDKITVSRFVRWQIH